MAGFTAYYCMLADQREVSEFMVEAYVFHPPGFIVMALVTFFALLFIMGILMFMTAVTGFVGFLTLPV